MPIKTILVYMPSVDAVNAGMATVAKIAALDAAHVVGLHVSQIVPLYAEITAELPPDVYEKLSDAGRRTAEAVKRAFEESAKANRLDHEWRYIDVSFGAGQDHIVTEARCADLVVCLKAGDDVPDPWSEFPEMAILESGRPVLLLPARMKDAGFGSHVVVAWNSTRESARAVFDSLDLLQKASTVRVVTVIDREDQRPAADASGTKLVAALSRHKVAATFDVSFAGDESVGEILLSRLVDEGCDLLVMGGYSRSPLREMILGGASRVILREISVPVLVSH